MESQTGIVDVIVQRSLFGDSPLACRNTARESIRNQSGIMIEQLIRRLSNVENVETCRVTCTIEVTKEC